MDTGYAELRRNDAGPETVESIRRGVKDRVERICAFML